MPSLDHKIPPPIVGALVGLAMWLVASIGPTASVSPWVKYIAMAALVATGLAFDLLGLLAFRASKTTVNPLPQRPHRWKIQHSLPRSLSTRGQRAICSSRTASLCPSNSLPPLCRPGSSPMQPRLQQSAAGPGAHPSSALPVAAAPPNPSLVGTATGKALGPRTGQCHHPSRGPSAFPASAPQLKR